MPKQRQPVELLNGILDHIDREIQACHTTTQGAARTAYNDVKATIARHLAPKKYPSKPLPF